MRSEAEFVRAALPRDLESLLQTLCAAFGIDMDAARPLFLRDPFYDLSHKRVLFTPNEGLVSCLTVIPACLRIGGAEVPVGGIAGVATQPQHQNRGHAGRLLAATVPALADELYYPVSALFPVCPDFYRRRGWETATRVVCWSAPAASLPFSTEASLVRPVQNESDQAVLHGLHAEATQTRTGAFTRDSRRWTVIEPLSPQREAVLYQGRSSACSGYMLYERQPDLNNGTLTIHEMYGVTQAARQGLVGFLAAQAERFSHIEWASSTRDLRIFDLAIPAQDDADPTQFICKPGMMLRLVDLRAALTCLHNSLYAPVLRECDATLTIRATDALFSRNETPLRLTQSGVEAGASSDTFWIAADIRILAQIYIGYRTPSDAARAGLLTTSTGEALDLADRLFPERDPYAAPADQF